MNKRLRLVAKNVVYGLVSVSFFLSGSVFAESIPVHVLSKPPVLDGDGQDWSEIEATIVPLKNIHPESSIATRDVAVSAGTFGGYIHFYLVWDDSTHDISHKSWVWDKAKKKYVRGSDREDRMAMQFEISGDYTTNWFSGNEFHADMWHWKSSRSNPLRVVHDKSTQISKGKLPRAYTQTSDSGETVYLTRPSDSGDRLYISKRYHAYQGDRLPKYDMAKSAQGSVADVEAFGYWNDGKWHLELRRAMDTGHADDVVFKTGMSVKAGIAIFDRSESSDHAISETLTFNLHENQSAELIEK